MAITIHHDLVQGTEQWFAARLGLLTASEMSKIVTPTAKAASNDKERAHVYELAAQRISGHIEATYLGDEMLRGHEDEFDARDLYSRHYAEVEQVGFITNDRWGFTLGCSPDGLVGEDGGIESKSRRQRFQIETIAKGVIPVEHVIQVQTCLLVTERKWWDFLSYSAGLPMAVIRAEPIPEIQDAILTAAAAFEARVVEVTAAYHDQLMKNGFRSTERRPERDEIQI